MENKKFVNTVESKVKDATPEKAKADLQVASSGDLSEIIKSQCK